MSRTILIGLDGATFSVLDPLMEEGVMPFLRELTRRGTRADLMSTPNPLTPPAWASLMTGRTPGSHGIFDFIRVEERNTDVYFTLNNSRDVRCETIWSILSRQGRSVNVLNFPLTAPPDPLRGCVVPGLVSWKHLRRNVHPADLYAELLALPGFSAREVAWDFDLERMTMKAVPPEEKEEWVQVHTRRERHWFSILRHMMINRPADLTAVLLDGIDKLQHVCWRFIDGGLFPATATEQERTIRSQCLAFFRQVDSFLEEIARLAGPEATLVIVSDHGFGPTSKVFRVNTWLHERGYLTWKPTGALDPEELERRLRSDVALVDLKTTRAYGRTSASNGICLRVPPREHGAFRERLTRELLDVRDPDTGERIVAQVLTREEAFPGAESRHAPDLTLGLADGGFVSILNKEPFLAARPEVSGTHRPNGVFVAAGPGVRKGEEVSGLSIVDVPAMLLHTLDLPLPSDFEARFPAEVFEASFLRARPPRTGEPTRTPGGSGPQGPERAPEAPADPDAVIVERLRALGYIE